MGTIKATNIQTITGSGTLTLGTSGETLALGSGVTSNLLYPAFMATMGTSNQNVTDATLTKVQCDTEITDVGGYYDNSTNYRYTPLVAGKYFVFGGIHLDATAGNYVDGQVEVRKNGTKVKYIAGRPNTSVNRGTEFTQTVLGIIDMNGSSDYLELWGYLNSNSGSTDFDDQFGTSFGAYRIGD